MVADQPTSADKLLYIGPTDAGRLEDPERFARIEGRTDAAMELLENTYDLVEHLSARFAVVEELLERYQPMLAAAESRLNGGRLGGLRRGVPRAQDGRERT